MSDQPQTQKPDADQVVEFVEQCSDLADIQLIAEAIRLRVNGLADQIEIGGIQ